MSAMSSYSVKSTGTKDLSACTPATFPRALCEAVFFRATNSVIAITDKTYPLVYVHFQGASTVENTQNFLARFDEWLSRKESFGILLRQTAMKNESIPEEEHTKVHRAIAQWAKQNKPRVANYCVGMAMVIDSTEAFETEKNKITKMINGMFGCSGTAFQTNEPAEGWLKNLLAKSA